jgi:hypothetical protein
MGKSRSPVGLSHQLKFEIRHCFAEKLERGEG